MGIKKKKENEIKVNMFVIQGVHCSTGQSLVITSGWNSPEGTQKLSRETATVLTNGTLVIYISCLKMCDIKYKIT